MMKSAGGITNIHARGHEIIRLETRQDRFLDTANLHYCPLVRSAHLLAPPAMVSPLAEVITPHASSNPATHRTHPKHPSAFDVATTDVPAGDDTCTRPLHRPRPASSLPRARPRPTGPSCPAPQKPLARLGAGPNPISIPLIITENSISSISRRLCVLAAVVVCTAS